MNILFEKNAVQNQQYWNHENINRSYSNAAIVDLKHVLARKVKKCNTIKQN